MLKWSDKPKNDCHASADITKRTKPLKEQSSETNNQQSWKFLFQNNGEKRCPHFLEKKLYLSLVFKVSFDKANFICYP